MCLSKADGGLRCFSHASKVLERAVARFEADGSEENRLAVEEAERALSLTQTERRRLKEEVEALEPLALFDVESRQEFAEKSARLRALTDEHAELSGETVFNKKYENSEARLEAYKEELENGFRSLEDLDALNNYLEVMSRFPSLSANNQMLILCQNPNATRVATFKKWQDEFGRKVKKGAKAIYLFRPVSRAVVQKDDDGNPVLDSKGKPVKKYVADGRRFTLYPVFSDEQTEGEPLPRSTTVSAEPPQGLKSDLEKVIKDKGFEVCYEDTGLKGGWASGSEKKVVISRHASEAEQVRTLAHELGHIAHGHTERDDYGVDSCRGEMEMEAESIAYVVCRANGMDSKLSSASATYIKGWNKASPDASIGSVFKGVSKTVKGLLTENEWSAFKN